MSESEDKDYGFELAPSEPLIVEASAPKLPSDLDDDESPSDPSDTGVLAGCCFLGWIVGGPCLALITTFGGNWAKNKEGPFGESTRALGRVADAAGKTANDDHLFDKIKESIAPLFGRNRTRSES